MIKKLKNKIKKILHKRNKHKHRMFFIDRTIYPIDILFCRSDVPVKDVVAYVKKEKNYKMSEDEINRVELRCGTDGRTVIFANGHILIRLEKSDTITGVNMSTLVHELSHAVHSVFQTIGYAVYNDNDESFAYYIGYLSEEILTKMGT